MAFEDLAAANEALLAYVPLVAQLTGTDTTLERITLLMALLGNPEQRLKVIHIAGTSGKTSTAYYIAALLQQTGKTIGLTVSPHVDKVTERIQINGQSITDGEFCAELEIFLNLIKDAEQPPSYFELLYAFAIWIFEKKGINYAVIETGMGGLHDATNITARPDKVCVITDIGFDHMHILGNSLPEIAAQKIGIVHNGNQTIMYNQTPEVMAVMRDWTTQHDAPLLVTTEAAEQVKYYLDESGMPDFQKRNWLLAKRVYDFVSERDGLSVLSPMSLAETWHVQVPGRMESRTIQGKTIIMDGAHNEQKMLTFLASFKARFPDAKPVILLAMKSGKEYNAVASMLTAIASKIIVTKFNTTQDLPAISLDPEIIATRLRQAGGCNVQVIANQKQAYQAMLESDTPIAIITGSFYLLSQLRQQEGLL